MYKNQAKFQPLDKNQQQFDIPLNNNLNSTLDKNQALFILAGTFKQQAKLIHSITFTWMRFMRFEHIKGHCGAIWHDDTDTLPLRIWRLDAT